MEFNKIKSIISEANNLINDLQFIEENRKKKIKRKPKRRRNGQTYTQVKRKKGGGFARVRKKQCAVGQKWSRSQKSCVKQTQAEKRARKKNAIKGGRTRRLNGKSLSKKKASNRLRLKTNRARKGFGLRRKK